MSGQRHTFSKRTTWDLSESDLSAAVAKARSERSDLIDLTISNPTLCGFDYGTVSVMGQLGGGGVEIRSLVYDPDPRGMRSARDAVSRYYADHEAQVDANAILLTASTSEAYSYLFRLLCDPGDEVLVAQPSYPLFDFLADLDDVQLRTYPLFYDFGWWIDFAELERRIGARTRAILVVHPNNPTGHWTHQAERERLEELCARHGVALIVDEVFLDYPLNEEGKAKSFASGFHTALTFVLSGISKVAALPQMKVAWMAVFGPNGVATDALSRLEMIGDTFLSVGTPSQLALPQWLAGRAGLQRQISERTRTNLKGLEESECEMLGVEAGWSAVLRVRGAMAEPGRIAETLLERARVIVHPASFYGMADSRLAVVSLLVPPDTFLAGIGRINSMTGAQNPNG